MQHCSLFEFATFFANFLCELTKNVKKWCALHIACTWFATNSTHSTAEMQFMISVQSDLHTLIKVVIEMVKLVERKVVCWIKYIPCKNNVLRCRFVCVCVCIYLEKKFNDNWRYACMVKKTFPTNARIILIYDINCKAYNLCLL